MTAAIVIVVAVTVVVLVVVAMKMEIRLWRRNKLHHCSRIAIALVALIIIILILAVIVVVAICTLIHMLLRHHLHPCLIPILSPLGCYRAH